MKAYYKCDVSTASTAPRLQATRPAENIYFLSSVGGRTRRSMRPAAAPWPFLTAFPG